MGKLGKATELGEAEHVASRLQVEFDENVWVKTVLVAGSVRRRVPVVNDVDILIELYSAPTMEVLHQDFPQFHWTPSSGLAWIDQVRVEIFRAPPGCAGATLQFLTGPGPFNVYLRSIAKRRGMKLSQYGLWKGEDRMDATSDSPVDDEYSIFTALDVPYLTPEERSEWRSHV